MLVLYRNTQSLGCVKAKKMTTHRLTGQMTLEHLDTMYVIKWCSTPPEALEEQLLCAKTMKMIAAHGRDNVCLQKPSNKDSSHFFV